MVLDGLRGGDLQLSVVGRLLGLLAGLAHVLLLHLRLHLALHQHVVDGGAAGHVALAVDAAGAEGDHGVHAGHVVIAGAGEAAVEAQSLGDSLAAVCQQNETIHVSIENETETM